MKLSKIVAIASGLLISTAVLADKHDAKCGKGSCAKKEASDKAKCGKGDAKCSKKEAKCGKGEAKCSKKEAK
jgi:hypothetical protein